MNVFLMTAITSILEQSFLFLPIAIGIYISYGILRIPDLTTDGTFLLGGALFALALGIGLPPSLAMGAALLGGALAGGVASFLQAAFRLHPLIVGILLVFILNTLTLKMMGRPNLSLFDKPSLFSSGEKLVPLILLAGGTLIGIGALLTSRLGLMLRAFGNHPTLVDLSGKRGSVYRMIGLSLSNGLVGFGGAIAAQANGYVDVGMGTGVVLIALGTVLLGKQLYRALFPRRLFSSLLQLFCCFLGVLLYFLLVHGLLSLGLDPLYLKLMIGICLLFFLAMTRKKGAFV